MPKLWSTSTVLAAYAGFNTSHEVLITVIYNLLDSGKDLILGLPFGLYSTFVVEQRHGFNKQSLALFIKDQLIAVGSIFQLVPQQAISHVELKACYSSYLVQCVYISW